MKNDEIVEHGIKQNPPRKKRQHNGPGIQIFTRISEHRI